MSAGSDNLRNNQEQADADGVMVRVLRQAVEETLAEYEAMLVALKAACGYMRNASIDLSTGCTKATAIRTIEGGLKLVEAAIAKAEGRLT